MPPRKKMVAIEGSNRPPVPGAQVVGTPDPDERIRVTVYVRQNPHHAQSAPSIESLGAQLPGERKYLTDEQVATVFGADPQDIASVESYARDHSLVVVESDPARRSVLLSGTVQQMNEAFGVELKHYESPSEHYRGREGQIHVPEDLHAVIEAVLGLDNRRVGRAYLRRANLSHALAAQGAAALPKNTYYPPDVGRLYNFPKNADGTGQTIGILVFNESGGGYRVDALQKYFANNLKMPLPTITNVVVEGRGNDPHITNDPSDSTGEVMLDIQVAGSVAPGAKLVMYFTEFTQQGWVDAIHRAVADTVNRPSVLSISYGNPEDDPRSAWTAAAIKQVNLAFKAAAAKGITICCASGDDGSRDQSDDGRAHADFPASSPYVLGCGGTRLESSKGKITREVVWNDSIGAGGGGISKLFGLPSWQEKVGVPLSANAPHKAGRGVPDVSGLADPKTGYQIINVDGSFDPKFPTGGTSATAPLWAALIARINQALGTRAGYLNPLLYTRFSTGVLRDITHGTIGDYVAGPGWDPCTGLGSPDGEALLAALKP